MELSATHLDHIAPTIVQAFLYCIISMVWGQDVPETGTGASFPKLWTRYPAFAYLSNYPYNRPQRTHFGVHAGGDLPSV
jgi:hypothetical protein